MSQVLPCLTLIYVSCHFQILLNILFSYFYLFSKCDRNIQKYCSNENSCVCFMGYSGYDCSQVEPTILPPPIRRTASPPDNTPPSVDKSHSTPTNTYIRKSTISVSHQKKYLTQKRTAHANSRFHILSIIQWREITFKICEKMDTPKSMAYSLAFFRLSNCRERMYHFK